MTSQVRYVRPDQASEECMALMMENRLRHLPVMDKGKLAGLVCIGDLVKDDITEQKFIIQQLEHYIAGERGFAYLSFPLCTTVKRTPQGGIERKVLKRILCVERVYRRPPAGQAACLSAIT